MPNPTWKISEPFNPEKDCCLCGDKDIEYQHNPDPLNGFICCSTCNDTIVVPLRIQIMKMNRKKSLI